MGKESKVNEAARIRVMNSVRGHDNSIAHAFMHSEGACPKCGCDKQAIMFCSPSGDQDHVPRLIGCELDGEHLHRLCSACQYAWIERCMDQAMLAQESGETTAESELAAALSSIAAATAGVRIERPKLEHHRGWIIRFVRDESSITITTEPAVPQSGKPAQLTASALEKQRPHG